jgi:hypothetical protein
VREERRAARDGQAQGRRREQITALPRRSACGRTEEGGKGEEAGGPTCKGRLEREGWICERERIAEGFSAKKTFVRFLFFG